MNKLEYNIGNPNLKYLNDLSTVKLLENVKQTKDYIEKNYEKDDFTKEKAYELLDSLKNLLKKTPGLIFNFFKYTTEEKVTLKKQSQNENRTDSIESFVEWMKQNKAIVKSLPKNIIDYDSFEKLNDDIKKTIENINTRYFWSLVKYLGYDEKNKDFINSKKNEINEIAKQYGQLDKKNRKKYEGKLKYFKINNVDIKEFLSDIESHIVRGSSRKDVDDIIKKYINEINIIYNKDNVLVVQTEYKPAIKELGSTSWCIQYSDSYFTNYCSFAKFNTQYVVFNFNLPATNRYSKFGITVDIDGVPLNGGHQDNNNIPIDIEEISNKTGVPIEIFKSNKIDVKKKSEDKKVEFRELYHENISDGNLINKLIDFLENIENKDMVNVIIDYNKQQINFATIRYIKEKKIGEIFNFLKDNYEKQINLNLFELISNNIFKTESKLLKFLENNKGDEVEEFYNFIFSKHQWIFLPFIDYKITSNNDPYLDIIGKHLNYVDSMFFLLSDIIVDNLNTIIRTEDIEEIFDKIISYLNDIFSLNKKYFTFIVNRIKYSSINLDFIDYKVSFEHFNRTKNKYKDLFNEIEGVITESVSKSKDYNKLKQFLVKFIKPEDYNKALDIYSDIDPNGFITTIKELYYFHKYKGDKYFSLTENKKYIKDIINNNMGGFESIFTKDTKTFYNIEEIKNNKYLNWAMEFLFPIFRNEAFLLFYVTNISTFQTNYIKNLSLLKKYYKDFFKEAFFVVMNNLIYQKISYSIIKDLSELYSFDKSAKYAITDKCIELLLDGGFMNKTIDEIYKIVNFVDVNILSGYGSNFLSTFILEYYENDKCLEFSIYYYNKFKDNVDTEEIFNNVIEKSADKTELMHTLYLFIKEVDDGYITKDDILSAIAYNNDDLTALEFSKVISEEYDEKLDCFIYSVSEFPDLNYIYDGEPFTEDDDDHFSYYEYKYIDWDGYDGYDDLDMDNIMFIGNVLLNDDIKELNKLNKFKKLINTFNKQLKSLVVLNDDGIEVINTEYRKKVKEFKEDYFEKNKEELEELKNVCKEILKENEYGSSKEVIDIIKISLSKSQRSADEEEYFNQSISNLPDFFIEKNDKSYRFNDKIEFFIEIDSLLDKVFEYIDEYLKDYGYDINIEFMIKFYFDYVSLQHTPTNVYGDIDHNLFNENFSDRIDDLEPKMANENKILRFKDF